MQTQFLIQNQYPFIQTNTWKKKVKQCLHSVFVAGHQLSYHSQHLLKLTFYT